MASRALASRTEGEAGYAQYAYEGADAGQVTVHQDEQLRVLNREDADWWYVRTDDETEGYMPAIYVALEDLRADRSAPLDAAPDATDAGSDAGSVAGSAASVSAASTTSAASSAPSGASSLSRFMKSANGKKKKQQVAPTPEPTKPATVAEEEQVGAAATVELLLLKEKHTQMVASSERQAKEVAAVVAALRVELAQATEQQGMDGSEMKAMRAALSASEGATATTQRANTRLQAATAEHVQTEVRLRAEIDALRAELDLCRAEPDFMRAMSMAERPDSATSERINEDEGPRRPQSAPGGRRPARPEPMVPQSRFTALGSTDMEPRPGSSRRPPAAGGSRPGSGASSRSRLGSGASSHSRRRAGGKYTRNPRHNDYQGRF